MFDDNANTPPPTPRNHPHPPPPHPHPTPTPNLPKKEEEKFCVSIVICTYTPKLLVICGRHSSHELHYVTRLRPQCCQAVAFSRANRNRTSPSEQTVFSNCGLTIHHATVILTFCIILYTRPNIDTFKFYIILYTRPDIDTFKFCIILSQGQLYILLSFASFYTLGQI